MTSTQPAKRKRFAVLRALVWQQWGDTRVLVIFPLTVAFLGAACSYLSMAFLPEHIGPRLADVCDLWLPIAWYIYIVMMLMLPFSEGEGLHPNLSQRTHTLPVNPLFLATVYLLYRAAFLLFLAFSLLALAHLTGRFEPRHLHLLTAGLFAPFFLYLIAQALLWTLGGIHLALAIVAFVLHLLIPLVVLVLFVLLFSPSRRDAALVIAAYAVAAVFGAFIGAVLERRGARLSLTHHITLGLPAFRRKPPPFTSPEHAQRWFEWRRRGYILPLATACYAIVGLLAILHTHARGLHAMGWQNDLYLDLAVALVPMAAFVAGVLFIVFDHNDRTSGAANFVLTRPLSTRSLAMQRLCTTAGSVFFTYLLLLTGFVIYLFATGTTADFLNLMTETFGRGPLAIILMALAVLGHIAVVWALITFLVPIFVTLVFFWLAFIAALVFGLLPMHREETFAIALLALGSAVLLALILWAYRRIRKAELRAPADRSALTFLSLTIAASVPVLLFLIIRPRVDWTQRFVLWLALVAFTSLFCVAPLHLMPLWHRRHRHR